MASYDNFFVLVTVFGIAMLFLFGIYMWEIIEDTDDIFEATTQGQNIRDDAGAFYDNLDFTFLIVFFAFHLGTLILAFALRSHPVVYVAGILLIAMLAILAAPLSNVWEESYTNPEFASAAASLTTTNYIMSNLPFIEILFGFVTIVILAGLARAEGFV